MAASMASTSFRQWSTPELALTMMSAIAQEAGCDASELKMILQVPVIINEDRLYEQLAEWETYFRSQGVTNLIERSQSWIVESQLLEEDSCWIQIAREDGGLLVPPLRRDGHVSTYEGDRISGGTVGWQASLLSHALAICRCRLSAGHSDVESD
eukprot:4442714-Amphidinium_carterae.1